MLIGIIGWVIVGVIAGFAGSKLVDLQGDDPRLGLIAGGAGGLIGGWIYSFMSGVAVSGFNTRALTVAGVGAVVALLAWHGWRRTSAL